MTNVMMPQMGESIAEGTIVRWIKKVGDAIDRDEPLFEISTDKVDAEIPSPAAGVLTEIRVKEGETVAVNSVVAIIGGADEAVAAPPVADAPPAGALPEAAVGQTDVLQAPVSALQGLELQPSHVTESAALGRESTREELRRQKSSPLVRRIARDHNIDIGRITGSGLSGRVTKHDILSFLESGRSAAPSQRDARVTPSPGPVFKAGEHVQIVPMSVMRRKIAEHMVLSARTSPHVYSVYEVNFARVSALREQKKLAYEAAGARLTFTAFIAKAVVEALRQFPIVNASVDGDNIVYKKDINLGIAVAIENGLIVPVIRNADEKNLMALSRAIDDLANRARTKKLNPEEVQGGTFTITNPGVFGALYGLPLINQPQGAIMGVGAIEKRAIVIDDAIAIRPVCHITLGYDHRLVDGADAGRFLTFFKERMEHFDEAWV
jgi:2-oxoglutarate dehydrogenase E2 component (dihydrolipoamide succinyltransferase)